MKNWKRMRKAILICGSSMIIAIYANGCKQSDAQKQADANFFTPPGQIRDVQRIEHAQMAAGAREDATLLAYHFDKGELNSLGREKLSLMLDDDTSNNPMIIYLDIPGADDFKAARQDAVVAYLKDQGLQESQISFRAGPNPAEMHLASEGLTNLSKTNTGGESASSSSSPGAGGTDSGTGTSAGGSTGSDMAH
jgi:hypothetical protein